MLKHLYRYFLLLQAFLGQNSYGQGHSENSLFNKFRKDIQQEQEVNNGRVVWDSETEEAYLLLMSTNSIETLLKYTDDSIPAVRATIFAGLVQKNADDKLLRQILNKHINDTAEYTEAKTDVVPTWTVSEYMQLAIDAKVNNKVAPPDYTTRLEKIRNEFRVIIPGAHHGIILKDSLLAVDSLSCSEKSIRILSFSFTIGNKTMTSNNVFTKQMKELVRNTKTGERVFFEEITVEGQDKKTRKLMPVSLIIR